MERPIPIDIIPSHVYLSAGDRATLFGSHAPMTIADDLSQRGQYVYKETLEVFGKLKRSLELRVLGPDWEQSFVELTPTEASFLGVRAEEVKTGDIAGAAPCRLVGPQGEVAIKKGVIIPRPHLLCSPEEASAIRVQNGGVITVDISRTKPTELEGVLVRVHPAFSMRLEIHQDYARSLWLTRGAHVRIRS